MAAFRGLCGANWHFLCGRHLSVSSHDSAEASQAGSAATGRQPQAKCQRHHATASSAAGSAGLPTAGPAELSGPVLSRTADRCQNTPIAVFVITTAASRAAAIKGSHDLPSSLVLMESS